MTIPPTRTKGRVSVESMPPASPPSPPIARSFTVLVAAPVDPEVEVELAPAPELALLMAVPAAIAAPVSPESPELPVRTLPPTATAVPRIPVLMAVGLDTALPVEPVLPELPEIATGFDVALELALPVRPELVALDWLRVLPELPETAVGLTFT